MEGSNNSRKTIRGGRQKEEESKGHIKELKMKLKKKAIESKRECGWRGKRKVVYTHKHKVLGKLKTTFLSDQGDKALNFLDETLHVRRERWKERTKRNGRERDNGGIGE